MIFWVKIVAVAQRLATEFGIAEGYRLLTNVALMAVRLSFIFIFI